MVDESFQKTLITGAGGMMGSYINFGIKTDSDTLDVSDIKSVERAFEKYKPEIVIHMAADTDVDRCEREPDRAYKINVVGTYNIAATARRFGTKIVYISTGGVFDGKKKEPYTEEDIPNPQNVHWRTKFLGEVMIRDIVPEFLIVRTGWIFGGGPKKDKKFVGKIIRMLNLPKIKAVSDTIGSPTYAMDLINGIKILIGEKRTGIYHLVNTGVCSRYDIACEIIRIFNAQVKVAPVASTYFNLCAPRVASEALGSQVNIMRSWQEALEEYLIKEWVGCIQVVTKNEVS